MNPLFAAALDIQTFATVRHWKCTVIGGLAVQRWGEPRQTRYVDLTLLTGLGGEEQFVDPLLEHYRSRIPDARRFALERRVLLIETQGGIPLDVTLGGLSYEERVVERSTPYSFEPGVDVVTCSAEDLVVLKAFAGRVQDWLDVAGIVVRQGARLDRRIIAEELPPLLELDDNSEAERTLRTLFEKHVTGA